MAGPAEEAGKVAGSAVDALKGNPAILALVILQFFILGAVLYNSIDRQRANTANVAELHALIDRCIARFEPTKDFRKVRRINMSDEKKPEEKKPAPAPEPKPDQAHENKAPPGQPATVVLPPDQR
jgi:hypothetical protein